MPGQSVAVHEIRWAEVFPGLLLFRAVRLAAEVPKLLLATVGLVLTWGGWRLAGQSFSALSRSETPDGPAGSLHAWTFGAWNNIGGGFGDVGATPSDVLDAGRRLVGPTVGIFSGAADLSNVGLLVLCTLWAAGVWALFAGAITRIAAIQLGRGERIGLRPALRFAARKWSAYFAAPLMPLAVVGAMVVLLAPFGLLVRMGAPGQWVAMVLWPIALLIGVFLTILVVGMLFGWPLMWATVSTENGDAFTALSNSYAYVFQRPWQLFGYGAMACALGALGWSAFRLLATLLLYLTSWAVAWSSGAAVDEWIVYQQVAAPPLAIAADRSAVITTETPSQGEALSVHGFWRIVVAWVVAGYGVSYFWTASTGVYLLLRQSLDGTEIDAVYLEDDQPRAGLPPLAADERGVPVRLTDEAPPGAG